MKSSPIYRYSIRLITVVGFVISVISLIHYVKLHLGINQDLAFCNIGASFNCDLVNKSKWAAFLGIPLASYGGAFYLFIFSLTFINNNALQRVLILLLASLASLFSILLFIISGFVIGSLCITCIGMYAVNFSLLGISLYFRGSLESAETIFKSGQIMREVFTFLLLTFFSLAYLFNSSSIVYTFLIRDTSEFYNAWRAQPIVDFEFKDHSALDKDYYKGDIDAPIQVVEFSDMECAACRNYYFILEKLYDEYQGKIRIVFKNFPLDHACNDMIKSPMHRNACYAALFARCAGEQDKFWQVLDYIFNLDYSKRADNPEFVRAELEKSYEILNLDEEGVRECLRSQRQFAKIRADIEEAKSLIVTSTPSIWINGRKLPFLSEEALRGIFNEILRTH